MDTHTREDLPQFVLPRGAVGRLVAWLTPMFHAPIHRVAARALALRAKDDVLDVACGNGAFLRKYASNARSIAGLDLSAVAIEAATKANRRRVADGSAEFVRADASRLPWPDDRFSAASVLGSFTVLPEPEATLSELNRVLRPGGRGLVTAETNAEDGQDHAKEVERWGLRLWSQDELGAAMYRAGFTDVRVMCKSLSGFARPMFVLGTAA